MGVGGEGKGCLFAQFISLEPTAEDAVHTHTHQCASERACVFVFNRKSPPPPPPLPAHPYAVFVTSAVYPQYDSNLKMTKKYYKQKQAALLPPPPLLQKNNAVNDPSPPPAQRSVRHPSPLPASYTTHTRLYTLPFPPPLPSPPPPPTRTHSRPATCPCPHLLPCPVGTQLLGEPFSANLPIEY